MRRLFRRQSQENIFEYFDMEQHVGKELVDKFTLWALRILINLKGINEFIDKDNEIASEEVACFLSMQELINNDDFTKKEALSFLTRIMQ